MGNINSWNAKIDKSLTVIRLGKNGILYEYLLPYGANPMHYYEDAIDVKSKKRSEKYNNGKRPGMYQLIGDKRYFNFYQMKKMTSKQRMDFAMADLIKKNLRREFLNDE